MGEGEDGGGGVLMVKNTQISRRKFIVYAWIAAAAITLGELIGGTFAFLWPRRKEGKGEKVFVAGKVSDFEVDKVAYFRKEKTFVLRLEGGFLAFSAICPHLRCIVNWDEMSRKFDCSCHGAKFNRNGEVLEGPPPRPLDLYKLQVVEGKLVIDMATPVERNKYEPSQLVKT